MLQRQEQTALVRREESDIVSFMSAAALRHLAGHKHTDDCKQQQNRPRTWAGEPEADEFRVTLDLARPRLTTSYHPVDVCLRLGAFLRISPFLRHSWSMPARSPRTSLFLYGNYLNQRVWRRGIPRWKENLQADNNWYVA